MTQTAEEVLAQAKQNAKSDQPIGNRKKGKTKADTNLESALATVNDTQYQNGLKLVQQIGEQGFMKGIADGVENYLAQNLDDSQFSAIADRIQSMSTKRLAASAPLTLPAAAFLVRLDEDDDEEEEDEDV
jgi:hypothetical protein